MVRQDKPNPQDNPSAYAYGENGDNSREIFQERQHYAKVVFPENLLPNFMDTWGADRFYGTINHKGNVVTVEESRLRPLWYGNGGTHFALDFVADAWADFSLRLQTLVRNGQLYENSPWSQPLAGKGWASPAVEYEKYMFDVVYPAFNDEYLSAPGRAQKIRGVDTFLQIFDDFVENLLSQAGPLTYSGFLESSYVSPLSTGLMVEMNTDANYDEDFSKSYIFKDLNFEMVGRMAAQYGFAVDKNIPWRFIADIRSPAMQEYMYGIEPDGFLLNNLPIDTCEPYFGDPENGPRAFGYSNVPGMEDVVRHVNVYFTEDAQPHTGYLAYQEVRGSTQQRAFEILFSVAYNEVWDRDPAELTTYLLSFYNALVEFEPFFTMRDTFSPTAQRCGAQTAIIHRQPADATTFNKTYGERWLLKSLYLSRARERQHTYSPSQDAARLQSLFNIYELSPSDRFDRARRYLQENFIGPYRSAALTLDYVEGIMIPDLY